MYPPLFLTVPAVMFLMNRLFAEKVVMLVMLRVQLFVVAGAVADQLAVPLS